MTFSIVAVDREAKEVGLAIASCCWDSGQVCMARSETGAIASQANGNLAFLPRFFDGLAGGASAEAILAGFRDTDPEIESRQIGMIPYDGTPLAFTGSRCSPWAGHQVGRDYACQGNILANPRVIASMATTFERTEGPLYRRLHAALAAADAEGGDLRGRQSARLAVKKRGFGQPGTDTFLDVSIEDHADPVAELGRILAVGETLMEILALLGAVSQAGGGERPGLLKRLRDLLDDKRDCRYLDWWESLGLAYHEIDDLDSAVEAFRIYLEINPALRPVLEAGIETGTFPAELAAHLFG
jgi:uncharacterized Ntn-hydrolase superfamily protein